MSKQNNANWDHYKVAGRERPGDGVHHDEQRQAFSGAKAHADDSGQAGPHIPNQERASPGADGRQDDAADASQDEAPDAQNINGNEAVQPTLSDDEGYTG